MDKVRKRAAVFVGQADESYQSRFISGFLEKAFGYDMDVCVFSMYRKYQDTADREMGESNIFSLMVPDMFDCAVIIEDSIQTAGAADTLEERLHRTFHKPVLVIEKESPYFPSVYTDCTDSIKELVAHLIEVHGYRDIAYLSGKKWHEHAQRRLEVFTEAMHEHGLDVPEDRIVYGDFWYQSGEVCADQLLADGKKPPEAVVCANDAMAIGLGKALVSRGVRVPEDTAVVSYDSTFEGQTSPVSITSAVIPARELGVYAAEYIFNCMNGSDTKPFYAEPSLLIGESCGCKEKNMPGYSLKRTEWETEISSEGFDSVNNTLAENILAQTGLEEYLGTMFSYAYQIKGAQSFHFCLAAPWKYMGSDASVTVPNEGYPDKMIYAVRYNNDRRDGHVGLDRSFDTSELLPALYEEREEPCAFFFTPVYCERQCYGYAAVSYGNAARTYDDLYRRWIGLVSRGFENLRRGLVIQCVQDQLDKIKKSKFDPAGAAYESLSAEEKEEYDLVGKILDENLLTYHFQPIVNTVDGSIYSYEALMRSKTEKRISPLSIIKYANMQDRLADVERATFLNVLSIIDSRKSSFGTAKVFINSIPGVRVSDHDFDQLAKYLRKHSDTAVVELTEEAELSDAELDRLKEFFRRLDIKIAVDDYGTGYSNVSNLLRYMPNYVKIDRSLLSEIQNKPQKQHFVREVISFCRDNNIMALAEGVETSEEMRTVINLGADLIQGYYTARPTEELVPEIDSKIRDEIRRYHQEQLNGGAGHIYVAGKTNRVTLSALAKEGCTEISVGQGTMVYKDITIIGTPGLKTDIHLTVESGYKGRITLENVYFSNDKNRPCVELGGGSDVTLVLVGENHFHNSGILVPEGARFNLEGEGNLRIELSASEYYGIGAGSDEKNGELIFSHSGSLIIRARGVAGTCIGSDLGGVIRMKSGLYAIESDGNVCVGIGSFSGNTDIDIFSCNVSVETAAISGVCIGSMDGSTNIRIEHSSFKAYCDGSDCAAIGTVNGAECSVHVSESGMIADVNSVNGTVVGAVNGKTSLEVNSSSFRIECSGEQTLAVGGKNENISIGLYSSDIKVSARNKLSRDTYAKDENITIINGRARFTVNGTAVERTVIVKD
ncbi:MAG: EAL domain-containing protein [Ruminiclostridium sp.]|nr:EAL domain-containing protein [Ruminiclostridium sp.]